MINIVLFWLVDWVNLIYTDLRIHKMLASLEISEIFTNRHVDQELNVVSHSSVVAVGIA